MDEGWEVRGHVLVPLPCLKFCQHPPRVVSPSGPSVCITHVAEQPRDSARQREGLIESGDSLVVVAELDERFAQEPERQVVVGVNCEDPSVVGDRVLEASREEICPPLNRRNHKGERIQLLGAFEQDRGRGRKSR